MLLQLSGICKNYITETILHNIHLQVHERDRIGLVGVNGAGKSTLLKIIAGEITPDQGYIHKSKEARIGYLAQNSGLDTNRTIWNEMLEVFRHLLETEQELRELEQQMTQPELTKDAKTYDAILARYAEKSEWFREQGGYSIEANIRAILHGMGFGSLAPDTAIATLSGGQKTRLALAKLLLQSPDLLMLDEPTNYLDIPTLTWLEQYLKSYAGAVLVVSHDRYFLDAVVNVIYEIERTEAKRYTGHYSKFIELKAQQYAIELKHYEKQQETIAQMENFVQRNLARASTTKRAQSRRKAIDRMERMERPQGDLKRAHFSFDIERLSGKDVLEVDYLSKSFPHKGTLFQNVSFQVRRGDSYALVGPNGIGKSTLLKILIGEETADSGQFTWGSHVKIGYYDQEQAMLNDQNTILDEVWERYPHMEEARIRTVLGNFLFSGEDVLKPISTLSGGEKARVSLAKLMLLSANLLILDEPTNHLDVFSKEVLESALMDYEGTLLFISHDRYFLNKMADHVLELSPQGTQTYLGNYDDFLAKKSELEELAKEQETAKAGKETPRSALHDTVSAYEAEKQARREERLRQRKIEQLEKDIAELEDELAQREDELALPEVYNDYIALQEKTADVEQYKAQLKKLYDMWEVLLR